MTLPPLFAERMKEMLGEEYDDFLKSYDRKRFSGLRVNTLKGDLQKLWYSLGFNLQEIPWTKNGYFYSGDFRPGKHPLHDAGAYYIQEPSAMAVAELVCPEDGDRILDLCAAPGGKSTAVAAEMQGRGLLVSNEIVPNRAKILSSNIERMGIENALVLNESPQSLSKRFVEFFDKIIVDAPCSGEGMFRKEEEALAQWSEENVKMCAERQAEILDCAAEMVRCGGKIIYSTCTFAPDENEKAVCAFLDRHSDFSICDCGEIPSLSRGNPDWANGDERAKFTYRVWPHLTDGEGHFMAVLQKNGDDYPLTAKEFSPNCPKEAEKLFREFEKEFLSEEVGGVLSLFGDNLYRIPDDTPDLKGLRVLRFGLHLGVIKKNRFEPSHSLAMSLKTAKQVIDLTSDDVKTTAYLRGETIPCENLNGWTLVRVDGYSVGWGKASNGVLKNHYPKGLRRKF